MSTDEDTTSTDEINNLTKKSKRKKIKKKHTVPSIDHLFKFEKSTGLYICNKCPLDDERRHPPLQTSLRKHLWHAHKLGEYLYKSQQEQLFKHLKTAKENIEGTIL